METQMVSKETDWKSDFARKLVREQKVTAMTNVKDTLNFFESYFDELQKELEVLAGDSVSFDPSNGVGHFYVDINHYLGVQIVYVGENGAVTLQTVTQCARNGRSTKTLAYVVIRSGEGPLILITNDKGDLTGEEIPLSVKWVDEKVKNFLTNAI